MNEPRLKTNLCSGDEAGINFFLASRREAEAGKEHKVTMMVMRRRFSLLLLFVMIVHLAAEASGDVVDYSKHDFPPGFVFGAGTSAYQVEGAANQDGRTPSILDSFAKSGMTGGDTGDIACDQYHKYKEDVLLMANTGLDAYRFSISWSRLIPGGRGPVNPKGIQYYNNLIDELTAKGIQPHVTLHHFDLPQLLEDEYGGWLSRKVVTDFAAYADVCFRMFGDRVKHWTTFNEANIFATGAYDIGILPPQHCSRHLIFNCSKGNSSTEPYTATHIMLLAHAEAARQYKMKYQKTQKGLIGINLFGYSFVPFTSSREDMVATQRAYDFYLGWYLSPLTFGDYPAVMKKNAGSRIPLFSARESKLVKGSADFIGLNFYAVSYIKDSPESLEMEQRDFMMDSAVEIKILPGNTSASMDWSRGVKGAFSSENEFPLDPWALQLLLEYVKQNFGNPPIYIHENGMSSLRNSSLEDWQRVRLLEGYIGSLLDSIRNGSDTRGYFVWSFLDVFELFGGFKMGFGLYYVDLDDPAMTRYPKLSAHWYSQFLKGGSSRWESFLRLMKNPSSSSSAVYKQ